MERKPETIVSDTESQIKFLIQEVHTMGFNDSEIPELFEILKRLKEGQISEEDALKAAQNIRDLKQDYH